MWKPGAVFWGNVVLMALAQPALSQTLGGALDDGISWWRVGGAFLFCLGLGVAGAFFLRTRLGQERLLRILPRPRRRLALIETMRLSPASTVVLVSCDGAEFLILTSAGTASVVDRLPDRHGDLGERAPP
jgi:hypothetical protein